MSYTISEVAEKMGITPSTLRYYDKEGLLPGIKRKNGIRIFEDEDFSWLRVLNCLKNTGMPIRKIRRYVELAKQGDATLKERYELIKEQRASVQDQMDQQLRLVVASVVVSVLVVQHDKIPQHKRFLLDISIVILYPNYVLNERMPLCSLRKS